MTVQGDPDQIHASAATFVDRSTSAGSQASGVLAAASAMPPSVDIGPAADAMRTFAGQLRTSMRAVSEAYDHVGTMLRQVAAAVQKAQTAEKEADRTAKELADAQLRELQAEQALDAAKQAASGPAGPFSAGLHLPGAGPATPAQHAAVAQAEQELARAKQAVEAATQANKVAQQRFHVADEERTRVLHTFQVLCEEAAALALRTIPQAPGNFIDIAAVEQLRSEAVALLDVPLLTASGYSMTHLTAVEHALLTGNASELDQWSEQLLRQALPAAHHSGDGGPLGWLASNVPVVGPLTKGAIDGTVGAVKGLWDLGKLSVENLASLPPWLIPLVPGGQLALLSRVLPGGAAFRHQVWSQDGKLVSGLEKAGPVGILKSAVGWDVFRHNAFEGIGNLIPSVASAVLTKGAGEVADTSALGGVLVASKAGDLSDAAATLLRAGDVDAAERALYGSVALSTAAKQSLEQAIVLKRAESVLTTAGYVGDGATVAGIPLGAAQGGPANSPAVPSLGVEWGTAGLLG